MKKGILLKVYGWTEIFCASYLIISSFICYSKMKKIFIPGDFFSIFHQYVRDVQYEFGAPLTLALLWIINGVLILQRIRLGHYLSLAGCVLTLWHLLYISMFFNTIPVVFFCLGILYLSSRSEVREQLKVGKS